MFVLVWKSVLQTALFVSFRVFYSPELLHSDIFRSLSCCFLSRPLNLWRGVGKSFEIHLLITLPLGAVWCGTLDANAFQRSGSGGEHFFWNCAHTWGAHTSVYNVAEKNLVLAFGDEAKTFETISSNVGSLECLLKFCIQRHVLRSTSSRSCNVCWWELLEITIGVMIHFVQNFFRVTKCLNHKKMLFSPTFAH